MIQVMIPNESYPPRELSLNTIFSASRSVGNIVILRIPPKSVSSTNPAICASLRKPVAIRLHENQLIGGNPTSPEDSRQLFIFI